MTHRWFFLLILIVGTEVRANELPTQPFLRVDAESHTAAINQLALTRDGYLLSVSDDKTARLWDGMLNSVATIRVPIGTGAEGALYVAAASPINDAAIVGGVTAISWDGGVPAFYAVDLKTARVKGRLVGVGVVGSTVMALSYSDDGRYLAVGSGGASIPSLLQVYDLTTHVKVSTDTSYADSLTAVLFLPDGRLATAALDGKVRLYSNDFRLIASQSLPDRARPKWLARSPSGDRLVVGALERKEVNILSTKKLQPLLKLSSLNKQRSGDFSSVAWSDEWIFGAGTYSDAAGGFYLHAWSPDGVSSWEIKIADDSVTSLLAMPGHRLAFATADATLGIVNTDSRKVQSRPRVIADFRDAHQGIFAVNQDASLIDFGTVKGGKAPLRFDLTLRRIIAAPELRTDLLAPLIPRDAHNWRNSQHPIVDGKPVALDKNEFSRAITALHEMVALGADYSLRLLRSGALAWKVGLASPAWAVNISGDGRYVIAALGDGTLRWYATGNGDETMALFVTTDHRWILWTPEGYFDHSPNADDLIGYHKNTGRATAPEFVSATQLYNNFFRPELITRKWLGKNITPAIQYTGQAAEIVAQQIPPEIELLDYCVQNNCRKFGATTTESDPLVVTQRDVILRVALNDRGSGIGKLTLKRNNSVQTTRGFARTAAPFPTSTSADPQRCPEGESPAISSNNDSKRCVAEKLVELEPGKNYIELSARERKNTVDGNSTVVVIRYELPNTGDTTNLTRSVALNGPELYVVSVGINLYNNIYFSDLKNAKSDALGIVEEISSKDLYPTVRIVGKLGASGIPEPKPLLDGDATLKNIKDALDYVAKYARPEDVVVLFIAGHGINKQDKALHSVYNFITVDTVLSGPNKGEPILVGNDVHGDLTNDNDLKNSLDQEMLAELINKIQAARISIFLDTCHSGQAGSERSLGSLSKSTGRFLLTGTASEQEALDGGIGPDGKGHGVFTAVLMTGLHGKADVYNDGFVDVEELSGYVGRNIQKEAAKIKSSHKQYSTTFMVGTKLPEFKLTKDKVESSPLDRQ